MAASVKNSSSTNVTVNINNCVVEIKAFRDDVVMPTKGTSKAAGYDLCAWTKDYYEETALVQPGSTLIVKTGLNVNIPENYEIQIRPRSGLAAKSMISVLNTPGTIDADYCGDGEDFELKVILVNHGKMPFAIRHGDRIAQMVICELPKIELKEVEEFSSSSNTDRAGGLGSTGV